VIKLYDVIENQKCKILILEYCSGGALDSYIKTRGPVDESDAVVILRQIILGLAVPFFLVRNCTETGSFIGTSSLPTSSSTTECSNWLILASLKRLKARL
jgi:serine/threonine protein kinase